LSLNTRKRIIVTEEQLILVVTQLLGKQLFTEQGEQLKIVYLGKREGNDGPDFQGALILNNTGKLLSGDIEVHVYARDWYRHGHHHNSKYNNVILHIVAQQHSNIVTRTQNGKLIRLICLPRESYLQPYLIQDYHLPCYQISQQRTKNSISHLLNVAGEQRFIQKATLFKSRMQRENANQVLYQGIMRALGYSQNMEPFEKLAHIVPVNFLEKMEPRESVYSKQAWLLGTAGLLPSQLKTISLAEKNSMERLEGLWETMDKGNIIMSEDNWQLAHIYPHNSPIRRILALGHIIQYYYRVGLLTGMLQLVYKAVPLPGHPSIQEGLMISADGHFLQKQKGFTSNLQAYQSTLLGACKAAQIEINVILPFAFAWGEMAGKATIKKKAIALYLSHRSMASNTITRHIQAQLGLEYDFILNACQQQGLIHLYKNYCTAAKCSQCPLLI
jgi:uncharacterized protein YjhX (UPF0386 family)